MRAHTALFILATALHHGGCDPCQPWDRLEIDVSQASDPDEALSTVQEGSEQFVDWTRRDETCLRGFEAGDDYLDDDRVLAPSVGARRELARSVYRACRGFSLLAFGAADTHLHLAALEDRERCGKLVHGLCCSLRSSLDLPVPFAPVRYKALVDQHHMRNAFHYTLGQRNRHGVQSDPFLDASSLPELLGLRLLGTDRLLLVREHLPRVRRNDLLRHLGPEQLQPVAPEEIAELLTAGCGPWLADAAAGALALPDLRGRQADTVTACAALARVLEPVASSTAAVAAVGRSSTWIRRLRRKEPAPDLERAVLGQVALRCWLWREHPDLLVLAPPRLPERS